MLTLIILTYDWENILEHEIILKKYGIMTKELVIHVIRIDETAGRGDSDSCMTSFEVIMQLKLQSTMKVLL